MTLYFYCLASTLRNLAANIVTRLPTAMAWGAHQGIDGLVARVAANDPTLTALALLPGRSVDAAAAASLFRALASNTTLAELHIGGRPLDAGAAAALGDALCVRSAAGVPPLTTLAAGDAAFGCAGVAALAPGLVVGTACADLEGRGVGAAGAAALAAALSAAPTPSLHTLHAARNPLGDAGAAALAPALSRLTALDASACGLGDAGAAALATALSAPDSRTVSLTLSDNPLGSQGVSALADALTIAPNLKSLALGGCPAVGDAGAAALAAALAHGAALTSLDISGCGVGDAGVVSLAEALSSCQLAELSLRGVAAGGEGGEEGTTPPSTLGDAGAQALGRALASSSCPLRCLDAGCVAFADPSAAAALVGVTLTSLTLAGTRLGDAGAAALATALTPTLPLTTLDVAACGVGVAGVGALAAAVAGGGAPALTTLIIGGNPAAEADGAAELVAGLRAARPGLDVAWRVADAGDLGRTRG